MVNPQAIERGSTLTTEDLAWLGGVIDGEGCISLTKRVRGKGRVNYKPIVVISNSDPDFVEEICRVLDMAKIGHWVTWMNSAGKKLSKRNVCNIMVSGFLRCQNALEILTPHIRAKKDQAELMSKYIEYRLSVTNNTGNSYSEKDDEIYAEMRNLKQKRAPETIRGGRHGDKI